MAKNSPIETRTSRMAYCSKLLLPCNANWTNRFQSISPAPSERGCALTKPRIVQIRLLCYRGRAVLYRSRQQVGAKRSSAAFKSASRPGRALTVGKVGALSDFDDIAVRIADVTAYLAVLGYRRRDELGSSP